MNEAPFIVIDRAPVVRCCRHHFQAAIGGRARSVVMFWKANLEIPNQINKGIQNYNSIGIDTNRNFLRAVCSKENSYYFYEIREYGEWKPK